jgi:predicted component of type VI protein secretion system
VGLGDRIVGGMKTIFLIEEQTRKLGESLQDIRRKIDGGLADHEKRLTRLETIIEITRPDGAVLRIAQEPPKGS